MSDAWMPARRPGVTCRIVGPEEVNGMTTWRVLRATASGWRQIGDRCFTFEEARERAADLVSGKAMVYFGHHKFEKHPL